MILIFLKLKTNQLRPKKSKTCYRFIRILKTHWQNYRDFCYMTNFVPTPSWSRYTTLLLLDPTTLVLPIVLSLRSQSSTLRTQCSLLPATSFPSAMRVFSNSLSTSSTSILASTVYRGESFPAGRLYEYLVPGTDEICKLWASCCGVSGVY